MKTRLTPTEIALKDLPPEGRDFSYTRETGELNDALKDLIGPNSYEVTFKITPMGNAFDLKGSVRTAMDLECSLCAIDLKHPVHERLNEMLVVQKPLNKGDQLSKANHAHEWVEDGPDYVMLESEVFHVPDYIHEVIGLAEPIRPLGKPGCDMSCENLKDDVKRWLVGHETTTIKDNPFKVLEKMKLKS